MKTKDVSGYLKRLGWSTHTDEVGDRSARFTLPDRVVSIIFGIRNYPHEQALELMPAVTTDVFSKACAKIDPGYGEDASLITSWNGWDFKAPEIVEAHVRQASDETIAWAQKQDLEAGLKANAELPTTAPGARPIWHLAALAVMGETEKLSFYLSEFEQGNRLGFVPYISREHIIRALNFAETHSKPS